MQGVKEKVKDAASVAKAKIKEEQAKAEEKMEKATAHSSIQKEIAHQRAKAKVAEAKMEMHEEKAQHREESIMHGAHRYGAGHVTAVNQPQASAFPAPVTPATSVFPIHSTTTYPTHPVIKKY